MEGITNTWHLYGRKKTACVAKCKNPASTQTRSKELSQCEHHTRTDGTNPQYLRTHLVTDVAENGAMIQ